MFAAWCAINCSFRLLFCEHISICCHFELRQNCLLTENIDEVSEFHPEVIGVLSGVPYTGVVPNCGVIPPQWSHNDDDDGCPWILDRGCMGCSMLSPRSWDNWVTRVCGVSLSGLERRISVPALWRCNCSLMLSKKYKCISVHTLSSAENSIAKSDPLKYMLCWDNPWPRTCGRFHDMSPGSAESPPGRERHDYLQSSAPEASSALLSHESLSFSVRCRHLQLSRHACRRSCCAARRCRTSRSSKLVGTLL